MIVYHIVMISIFMHTIFADHFLETESERSEEILTDLMQRVAQEMGPDIVITGQSQEDFDIMSDLSNKLHREVVFSARNPKTKADSCILIVENKNQLVNIVSDISKEGNWNSRGKYLVLIRKAIVDVEIAEIFLVFWKYYVFNVNIIIIDNYNVFRIITWFPYARENKCGTYFNTTLVAVCEDGVTTLMLPKFFPNKIPMDLNKCLVRVIAFKNAPYVIDWNKEYNPGIEVSILRAVASHMNIHVEYVDHNCSHWGYKHAKGKYTLLYGLLFEKKGDLVTGMLLRNSSYDAEFDSTFSYINEAAVWFVPAAGRANNWSDLFTIFQLWLWIGVVIILVLMSILWVILGSTRTEVSDFKSFDKCFFNAFGMLLNLPVMYTPDSLTLRAMFYIWALSAVHIDQAYQTKLISVLTRPGYAHQISTEQEIVAQLKVGFYPIVKAAFDEPEDKLHWFIYNNYVPCPLTLGCITRVAEQRDIAVVKTRRQVRYAIAQHYSYPSGRSKLYEIDAAILPYTVRTLTSKGYPLLERIDQSIIRLHDNGLLNKFDVDSVKRTARILDDNEIEPLKVQNFMGVFILLALGHLFAFVVFIGENMSSIKRKLWRGFSYGKNRISKTD